MDSAQSTGQNSRVVVVIPTYNESENVAGIVRRVRHASPSAHVLVVDDASPDGTGRIADALAIDDTQVHVLHRAAKSGLGAAYLDGFAWSERHGFDVVIEMDADGSHLPEQLPHLLARITAGADLVLGSRYVPGGRIINWPWHRELLSRGGNSFVRLALGVPLRDVTGGFRAIRVTALEALKLADVASQGYCFQVDLVWRATRAGLRVEEVPITFVERVAGVSKMNRGIIIEALWRTTKWSIKWRRQQIVELLRNRPQKGEPIRSVSDLKPPTSSASIARTVSEEFRSPRTR